MPFAQIYMLEGRTEEQKKAVIEKVTQALVDAVGAPPANVPRLSRRCERICWRSISFIWVMFSCETTTRTAPSPGNGSTRQRNHRCSLGKWLSYS